MRRTAVLADEPFKLDIKPFPQPPWGYADHSHALPCQILRPTGVNNWIIRLPGGREIGITKDEFNALVPVS